MSTSDRARLIACKAMAGTFWWCGNANASRNSLQNGCGISSAAPPRISRQTPRSGPRIQSAHDWPLWKSRVRRGAEWPSSMGTRGERNSPLGRVQARKPGAGFQGRHPPFGCGPTAITSVWMQERPSLSAMKRRTFRWRGGSFSPDSFVDQ